MARRELDPLRRRPALHPEAAAGRRLRRRPSRSPPTMWCFRSRRPTTRGSAAGRFAAGEGRQARGHRRSTRARWRSPFRRRSGPACGCSTTCRSCPRHKLQAALDAGTFGDAWGLSTPVAEITGLGPFVLNAYLPGQRIVLTRNDRYFRKDDAGAALPYLDRITVEIVPEQNAQLLRLQAGQSDMPAFEMRPEDYAPLKRAADDGHVQLLDLGPGPRRRRLLDQPEAGRVRRAIRAPAGCSATSCARRSRWRSIARRSPTRCSSAPRRRCSVRSRRPTRNGTRTRCRRSTHDPARAPGSCSPRSAWPIATATACSRTRAAPPARFTLLTQKGQTALERGAAVIRDELKKIGLTVDVVMLDGNALVQRFLSGKGYDAVYFRFGASDTDPAINPDFWFSCGGRRTSGTWRRRAGDRVGAADRRADGAADGTSLDDGRAASAPSTRCSRSSPSTRRCVYFAAPRDLRRRRRRASRT